jgi:ATP-dependent Clp protease ATP-binding subunit ClpC
VVVDTDGDPHDLEHTTLVFRGADKPVIVPDAVPAELGGAAEATGSSE